MSPPGSSSKLDSSHCPHKHVSSLETVQRSISVDPLQLSTDRTQSRRPLTSNVSLDSTNVPPSPQSPPPPPAAGAPPPPPAPAPASNGGDSGDRSQLLNSITDFSMAKLKKAKTNDRSAPKLK